MLRPFVQAVFAGSLALSLPVALAQGASGQSLDAAQPGAAGKPPGVDCLRQVATGPAVASRERVFASAATTFGVPEQLLLGVSYLESRWDDHGAAPSTSGGYGPLHLTDVVVPDMRTAKGDGSVITSPGPAALHTARLAARLTGLGVGRLEQDPAANVCGGAAVLAAFQRRAGEAVGERTPISAWWETVLRYSGTASSTHSETFARQVFATIKGGASRTTNDDQRVVLPPRPGLAVPAAARSAANTAAPVDCPPRLQCEWIRAPYRWYGAPDPTAYGNHDVAHRPADMSIDFIVIHVTEGRYASAVSMVSDPRYVSWNYTIRSSDGHVAQHLRAKNVGWQAGNWYVNMHSIGIEHEGFAASGATWYTEAMYESSAALVRHLAAEYGVPLDRAHIIGHDQVPGPTAADVAGMHWDPGPYWNWQHYMRLLGAPIKADRHHRSSVVTVAPGFRGNREPVTDCGGSGTGACRRQGTNFVYLHTAPRHTAPLVKDTGLHRDGSFSTTGVWDVGARVDAGQQLVVADRSGAWRKVWYLGHRAWLYSPTQHPVVVPSQGKTVHLRPGKTRARVYGRAYPEAAAYPATIHPQPMAPLPYTIKRGQSYVLADASVPTDYYYATTYDDSRAGDHTVVTGKRTYYEIWFGHRMAFVRAADVVVR